ncbi:12795_t:CDS:2 [Entrophospora sp. SA101]|nr:4437_t:CDS:2 [Entrophospora sp. SA101]CAJ0637010.1 15771_t:CDS:2 [Entrophospora sp. SA101]CAJ0761775.1 12795_t:CDS:2 [Entrophospora sp. SA101]CAJ0895119.1 5248_t:CDS:2 [Entrophospora sp. SA101]CAJ0902105.1 13393_t:CDS:2 [Entrophospora sp. SA101]
MNKELIQKISQIESQAQNIKAILKEQANHIGKYYKALKEITSQLAIIKEKLTMTSLAVCAACAGIGFVGGKVVEAVVESGNNKSNNQAPPEAYNLLNKSLEEINKLREELRQQHEEGTGKANKLENRLKEAQAKQRDPNLTTEEKEQ